MKKLYWALIVIAALLVLNEFVLFPIFPSVTTVASCSETSFYFLKSLEGLIIIGQPISEKWVKREIMTQIGILPGSGKTSKVIFTDTDILIERIIKGNYNRDKVKVTQMGGCDIRRNICMRSSIESKFEKGKRYLLFLSVQYDDGTYGGISACAGKYEVKRANNEDVVECFARDIENCDNGYVRLNDLIEQIKE